MKSYLEYLVLTSECDPNSLDGWLWIHIWRSHGSTCQFFCVLFWRYSPITPWVMFTKHTMDYVHLWLSLSHLRHALSVQHFIQSQNLFLLFHLREYWPLLAPKTGKELFPEFFLANCLDGSWLKPHTKTPQSYSSFILITLISDCIGR